LKQKTGKWPNIGRSVTDIKCLSSLIFPLLFISVQLFNLPTQFLGKQLQRLVFCAVWTEFSSENF